MKELKSTSPPRHQCAALVEAAAVEAECGVHETEHQHRHHGLIGGRVTQVKVDYRR